MEQAQINDAWIKLERDDVEGRAGLLYIYQG
jgi:hypothetical protein